MTNRYHEAMLLHELDDLPSPSIDDWLLNDYLDDLIWRDGDEIVILDRETGEITRLYDDDARDYPI